MVSRTKLTGFGESPTIPFNLRTHSMDEELILQWQLPMNQTMNIAFYTVKYNKHHEKVDNVGLTEHRIRNLNRCQFYVIYLTSSSASGNTSPHIPTCGMTLSNDTCPNANLFSSRLKIRQGFYRTSG
ncbi:hypothetical protein PHET_03220 [Paragonimus heterotremus]|uniref:Fibronectin type-III domain-containing protein n=1 Tax=Paragonimus heterotremus TaxID=100268 RepID=A0A8J4WI84_9TREM|nr:hypothetical protein PHET_03220 [Paragonimus heterotremus]